MFIYLKFILSAALQPHYHPPTLKLRRAKHLHICILTHASFQANGQQLLCFHGKFHGQLVKYFFCVAFYDHVSGLFIIDPALVQVKHLIFPDLGPGGCCPG